MHTPGKFHKTTNASFRYPCGPAELFLEDKILTELVELTEAKTHTEVMVNLGDIILTIS